MSMGAVPDTWSFSKLEDLFEHVIGGDWGKDEEFVDEDYARVICVRGAEFKKWKKERGGSAIPRMIKKSSLLNRKLNEGDILIEISGGGPDQPVGRTVLIDRAVFLNHPGEDLVCTNFLRLARPVKYVNSSYLNSYLRSFYLSGEVKKYQGGSNNLRNLKFKDYSRINVPIPPLAEQKQIATKLECLLSQVDTLNTRLDAIQTILKRFRQSVLAAAVSGRLTKKWRQSNQLQVDIYIEEIATKRVNQWAAEQAANTRKAKYKLPESILDGPRPNIPELWRYCSLSTVTSRITYGLTVRPEYVAVGVPIISAKEVRSGIVDYENAKMISLMDYDKQREKCKIFKGDVLFSKTGTIGSVALATQDVPACSSQNIAVLTPLINSRFLECVMRSPFIQKLSSDSVKTTAIPDLQLGVLAQFPIPIPHIEEQIEIVRRVEQLFVYVDQVERQLNDVQSRVNQFTQSILKKTFSGDLTAGWRDRNPNLISGDHSANKLLEQIKAEKEKKKTARKTRSKKVKVAL